MILVEETLEAVVERVSRNITERGRPSKLACEGETRSRCEAS